MKKLLFVCTGNTCRSPMAQGIFQKMLADKGISGIECSSAGLFAMTGDEVTPNAVAAAESFGADISAHRARRITSQLLDETDLFVCLSENHAKSLSAYVDEGKIIILGSGIPDPYGGDTEKYLICANSIKTALENQLDDIVGRLS